MAPLIKDETLIARVRTLLRPLPKVEEKKMFGSLAFMVRGHLCVSARAERIMCRIDPSTHDDALKRPGARPIVMKGREYPGYLYVDAQSLKSPRALKYWVDQALAYNQAKKAKP